ncbi:MAG: sulfur oxidation c-type cytochrome SoxA [Lysobacterales bacterium]
MKSLLIACFLSVLMANAFATPEQDRLALRAFFAQRFPDIDLNEMINGLYAFDEGAREQWLEMEEFPPYEIAIEAGEEAFNQPFANGKGYADCFENGGIGIRQNYPRFDADSGEVITLEYAINKCRAGNGEAPLPWLTGELANISAYMAYTSRGNKMNVVIPDDPRAIAAYEAGKEYYYTRRGQLEFACENCHMQSAGLLLRADRLSALLGQATHWPVYRSKWGEIGTLHKRFMECNAQVRAKPYEAQSTVYRDLEYFMSYMSNGMELNGPASRR